MLLSYEIITGVGGQRSPSLHKQLIQLNCEQYCKEDNKLRELMMNKSHNQLYVITSYDLAPSSSPTAHPLYNLIK